MKPSNPILVPLGQKRWFRNLSTLLLWALATQSISFAQPLSVHTMAGNGTAGATNGFGSNARFAAPESVAADGAGNIYVADTANNSVRKITPDGYAGLFVGQPGSPGSADGTGTSARFYGPQGVAADATGQLYVADSANGTIRKVTSGGAVTTFAGAAGSFNSLDGTGANALFYHPEAVALDAGGNLYVADTWNHTIRKITSAGSVSTLAGLAGNFGSADGTNSKARFYRPAGIAVDSATNLFITDSFNHTIRKVTPGGRVSTIAGLASVWGNADGTNNAARFYLPQGISVAPSGDIFVADSGNQTLRKISAVGTNWVVSTVAGANGMAGFATGAGTNALFDFPAGLAFDNAGYLYLADMANDAVRTTRIVPPTLQYTSLPDQIILSWPTSSDGFVLEQSSALGAGASWAAAPGSDATVGDNFVRTNNTFGTAFYRLHQP